MGASELTRLLAWGAEDNVDVIVVEGGIQVVVPLLSLFKPAEPSYREYVATRCAATGRALTQQTCRAHCGQRQSAPNAFQQRLAEGGYHAAFSMHTRQPRVNVRGKICGL